VIVKVGAAQLQALPLQIDELLKPRIENSGLKDYFHVVAEITGKTERKIIGKFEI